MAYLQSITHTTTGALLLLGCGLRAPATTPTLVSSDQVQVTVITSIEPNEHEKLRNATALLASTLKSKEFRDAVLAFEFSNPCTSTVRGAPNCKDLDSANGCDGTCILGRLAKVDVDWAIRSSPPLNIGVGEIGSTKPELPLASTCGRRYIQTYEHSIENFTAAGLAGHLLHEYMHVLGFGHDFERTPRRGQSVPYAIGYMACTLAAGKPWNPNAIPDECGL